MRFSGFIASYRRLLAVAASVLVVGTLGSIAPASAQAPAAAGKETVTLDSLKVVTLPNGHRRYVLTGTATSNPPGTWINPHTRENNHCEVLLIVSNLDKRHSNGTGEVKVECGKKVTWTATVKPFRGYIDCTDRINVGADMYRSVTDTNKNTHDLVVAEGGKQFRGKHC